MKWREKEALKKCRPQLCTDLQIIELLTVLEARDILSDVDCQLIRAENIRYTQNGKFLDILITKGFKAFSCLISALNKTRQSHIADYILKSRDDIRGVKRKYSRSNAQLSSVLSSLKTTYMERFRKVHPFSMPFTFDIESTWVSLALEDDSKHSEVTEDHAEVLRKAFSTVQLLIIEGKPATGKTSLMRRLAFEWAKGYKEFARYELVIYAEFRGIRREKTETIAELVISYLRKTDCGKIADLINDKQFCMKHEILVLLDGYDESNLEEQCNELNTFLSATTPLKSLCFYVVMTTRPGYLSKYRGLGRFMFADVLGFKTEVQKRKYISNHFSTEEGMESNIAAVHHLLESNSAMTKLAETPLFLTFICLVHKQIHEQITILELYCTIVWWILDRHQKDFPDKDIPCLFGLEKKLKGDKFLIIQDYYLQFPQLHCLGYLALKNNKIDIMKQSDLNEFQIRPICEQVGLLRKEEKREKFFKRIQEFHFPHRTIQEFLAAFSYFIGTQIISTDVKDFMVRDIFNKKINPGDTEVMTEYEKFLWRIVTSADLPVSPEIRSIFFQNYSTLVLDLDIFSSSAEISFGHLETYLGKCSNITRLFLHLNSIEFNCKLNCTNLPVLESMDFRNCSFQANSQFSCADLPVLESMDFNDCIFQENSQFSCADFPALESMVFIGCTFQENSQFNCTNLPMLERMVINGCNFQANSKFSCVDLPVLERMDFNSCIFQANSKFSCPDLPVLEHMDFNSCLFQANSKFGCADLPVLKSMDFNHCKFQTNSQFSCANFQLLERMDFNYCEFQAISQFNCTNLPVLKSMGFNDCEFQENSQFNCTNLPLLERMDFNACIFQENSKFSCADLRVLVRMVLNGCIFQANSKFSCTMNNNLVATVTGNGVYHIKAT